MQRYKKDKPCCLSRFQRLKLLIVSFAEVPSAVQSSWIEGGGGSGWNGSVMFPFFLFTHPIPPSTILTVLCSMDPFFIIVLSDWNNNLQLFPVLNQRSVEQRAIWIVYCYTWYNLFLLSGTYGPFFHNCSK